MVTLTLIAKDKLEKLELNIPQTAGDVAPLIPSSLIPSLRVENGAIDPPLPSYFVSGCNLSLSLKSEMFPLFVYRSPPCLSRPSPSTLPFMCPGIMFLNNACENENVSSRIFVVEPKQLTLLFRNRLKSNALNYRNDA